MKFRLIPLFILFLFPKIYAQEEREQQPSGDLPGLKMNTSRLYGKLVDKTTGKGIEAASVQVYLAESDSLIGGMLTKANGDFNLQDIKTGNKLRIVFSAIGYEPIEQVLGTNSANRNRGNAARFEKDLGNISLQAKVQELGGVTVSASKPIMEMGVDRRIYNVAKSFVSTGGTAIDVMKNIPSVSVDIDGIVTLRNSSPQIFIDGRPTILTLDQIPADNIEKVELITNPSAKFDAASSGGIINIVLKKNKRVGLNGIITAGIGTPKVANGNLNLNMRQGKFNIFLTGGYNQSGGKAKSETMRQNKSNGVVTDYFNQYTINDRLRRFQSLRFGTDYFIDNRNTLTISQDFGKGRFSNEETQEQEYLAIDQSPEYFGNRTAESRAVFKRNSTRLSYKHSFPQMGRELTADVTYNRGRNTENSDIYNSFLTPAGSEYKPATNVRNEGKGDTKQLTFQADYAHPLGEGIKFEAGARSFHNNSESYYNSFAVDNGSETKLPLSNNYRYTEMVNAVYANLFR